MNTRKLAAALVTAGLAAGLVGAGIGANYTDSATASVNTQVGTFGCTITSPTAGAVQVDAHTITFAEPDITQSSPQQGGNALDLSIDLHNTGSMPIKAHWTITGPDYNISPYNRPPWNSPNGHFGTSAGSPSMTTDVDPFAPGAIKHYDSLGFMWLTPLDNTDLNVTLTATYHVDCNEHVVAASHISFVGASEASAGTVALPAGWQPGDLAITYACGKATGTGLMGTGVPTAPGTWTGLFGSRNGYSYCTTMAASHILAAGDGSVSVAGTVYRMAVFVYRGASGAVGYPVNPGNNQNWNCSTSYNQLLTKIDGSSWVLCVGGDGTGTFNVASAYGPTAFPGTVNRSSGFADHLIGASDTNGGVAVWTPAIYASGDYAHGGANWGIEILSQ